MVFAHDSFLGWTNLIRNRDRKTVYQLGERPPFPVVLNDPDLFDVVDNLNKADFGVFLACNVLGRMR
jgi:hypothetical protein